METVFTDSLDTPMDDNTFDDTNDGLVIQENGSGGTDIFENGQLVQHTAANVYGGKDVYQHGQLEHITMPNENGSIDVYDEHMIREGSMTDPGDDDTVYLSLQGNGEDMLNYEDPLMHAGEFRPDPFDASGHKTNF